MSKRARRNKRPGPRPGASKTDLRRDSDGPGARNPTFGPDAGGHRLQVKDLVGHFGIGQGSVSQRSAPLLRAIGVDPHQFTYGGLDHGDKVTAG